MGDVAGSSFESRLDDLHCFLGVCFLFLLLLEVGALPPFLFFFLDIPRPAMVVIGILGLIMWLVKLLWVMAHTVVGDGVSRYRWMIVSALGEVRHDDFLR